MNQIAILNRAGAVLYTGGGETLRDVLVAAVRSGADLSGADLSGAYLRDAYLRDAYLRDADLSDADLRDANLRDANLRGADLSDADLSGAYLSGAYLRDANLRDADLSGAYLSGAYLSGAVLYGGIKLVGLRPILQLGPIGSRSDYLVSYLTTEGVIIRAGCFFGALDMFRAACIETHGDGPHGREYAAAIAMIESHAEIWTPVEQEVAL